MNAEAWAITAIVALAWIGGVWAWLSCPPRVTWCRWGGAEADGLFDYDGCALSIEWLGCIVGICIGKVRS